MTKNYSERIENALNDIQKIQTIFRQRYQEECLADKEIEEVLKIARLEHEEIQQYQAIGTVEELKKRYAKLKEYEEMGTPNEIRAKLCFLTTYKRADSDGRLLLILDKNGYCEELGGLHIDEIRKRCLDREEKKD